MDSRRIVLQETGVIAVGQAIGVAAMFGVFAMLGHFDRTVLLGGVIGALLAIVNFFMMAVSVSSAADRVRAQSAADTQDEAQAQSVKAGKAQVQTSYATRLIVIFVVLFACVKSGMCNVFASVIPLLFVRPTITIAEFFRKSGEA